jgi:hypothetical protein
VLLYRVYRTEAEFLDKSRQKSSFLLVVHIHLIEKTIPPFLWFKKSRQKSENPKKYAQKPRSEKSTFMKSASGYFGRIILISKSTWTFAKMFILSCFKDVCMNASHSHKRVHKEMRRKILPTKNVEERKTKVSLCVHTTEYI